MAGRPTMETEKAAAKACWFSLPPHLRTSTRVVSRLEVQGLVVAASSVKRWMAEWVDADPPDRGTPFEELAKAAIEDARQDELEEVPLTLWEMPDTLSHILTPRVAALFTLRGISEVDDMIGLLARAIGMKSKGIAINLIADPETARAVLGAVGALSQAVLCIAQSKALAAQAHRNFAEGDRAQAEADIHRATAAKLEAEASAIHRANGAKVINNETDDAEQEAYEALRGMVKQ